MRHICWSFFIIGGSPVPKHYSHIRWGDQLDTGNVLIKRKVFEKVGLLIYDLKDENGTRVWCKISSKWFHYYQ